MLQANFNTAKAALHDNKHMHYHLVSYTKSLKRENLTDFINEECSTSSINRTKRIQYQI